MTLRSFQTQTTLWFYMFKQRGFDKVRARVLKLGFSNILDWIDIFLLNLSFFCHGGTEKVNENLKFAVESSLIYWFFCLLFLVQDIMTCLADSAFLKHTCWSCVPVEHLFQGCTSIIYDSMQSALSSVEVCCRSRVSCLLLTTYSLPVPFVSKRSQS